MKNMDLKFIVIVLAIVAICYGIFNFKNKEQNLISLKDYYYKCIDNKQYLFYKGFGDRSGITIVLDDDGKPIKCQ